MGAGEGGQEPEWLQALRENSRIRLDREGRFWHEDVLVEHPKVAALFHRGLGRAPDGRPTLTVGPTWCYIEAEDTLYLVRRAICEVQGERLASCLLRLDDGSEELLSLERGSLALDGEGVLHVRVKAGTEWARLIPEAHAALGRFVTGAEGLALATVKGDLPIGER